MDDSKNTAIVQQVLAHIESLSPEDLLRALKMITDSGSQRNVLQSLYFNRYLEVENACVDYLLNEDNGFKDKFILSMKKNKDNQDKLNIFLRKH